MIMMEQSYAKLLIEAQLFPPVATILQFMQTPDILLEACEHYQKRSFRNRYWIGSHQGRLELSIPLCKGKNMRQNIRDVKISYAADWPGRHYKALQTSYGNAAFFLYYKDELNELLFSKPAFLFDFNLRCLEFINKQLKAGWSVSCTTHYSDSCTSDTHDLRSAILPKTIASLPLRSYYQVYSAATGFLPQLSILDLLFHKGPESLSFLEKDDGL